MVETILARTRTLQCVTGFLASSVLPMCSGCPDGLSEDIGKVLDVVALLGRAIAQPDDGTAYRVSCTIADDRGNITQLVGYR
jgi:catabolite regulation protein CreA